MRKTSYLITILFVFPFFLYGQLPLQGIIEKLQVHQEKDLQEKIFVHSDRTSYATGENIWIKVYVVDGYTHQLNDVSKVAYVEVLNRNNQPIIQAKIKLEDGVGYGVIEIPVSVESDNYVLRAYTHWMKNFSADFYFHQPISIINLFQRLEEKVSSANIENDIQFFPEGGHLVDGIPAKVAFRAVNNKGVGIDFDGILVNQKGDTLSKFRPVKFGIGNFQFTPQVNEHYRLQLTDKNGRSLSAVLPEIKKSGYSIYVRDTVQNRIKITVYHNGPQNSAGNLYFIAHTRQITKVATAFTLSNGKHTFLVNKDDIGTGVTHFTVFDHRIEPICERLYYKYPEINSKAQLKPSQSEYDVRSKVTIQLNNDSKGVLNSSLSVFKIDSIAKPSSLDVKSYLWLSSELKGSIESPEYYFQEDIRMTSAIDNLMLTHGWSRFKWDDVLNNSDKSFPYLPEYRGHLVTGNIKGFQSSKPLIGIPAYLAIPDKKIQPYLAYSNTDGEVIFETHNLEGNKKLIAQVGVFKDSARIEINSPFSTEFKKINLPELKISVNLKPTLTDRMISMQTEDIYYRGRMTSVKAIQTDSANFYGKASEEYKLDDYTRFPLMEEVLREYVKGVRVRKKDEHFILRTLNGPKNLVFENDPLLLLDGVPVFNADKIMEFDPLKIKSAEVVTNLYQYGNFTLDGILSFKTYKNDLAGFQFDPGTVMLDYEGLQLRKEFFSPIYDNLASQQMRTPDFRNLLVWIPELSINENTNEIIFYSSDSPGNYQAVLQGISSTGEPIFATCLLSIKKLNP